ncbi:MAG: DUF4340 domain-containing protein [Chromatiales bacterium]|nr:DUF4340 domain-containing protein [Chromatiales bacterium]
MSRSTIGLATAVIVVGVLSAVVIFEPGLTSRQEKVSQLAPQSISRIEVEHGPKLTVRIERTGGQWRITAPLQAPANPMRAGALTRIAAAGVNRSYALEDISLDALGLNTQAIVLRLDGQRFEIGGTEPLERLRYVRHKDRVYLVADTFLQHLEKTAHAFVDPSLLGVRPEVVSITTANISAKRGNSGWQWSPNDGLESADQVTALVADWQAASALRVEPFNEGALWRAAATLKLHSGKVFEFEQASRSKSVLLGLRSEGLQYRLPLQIGQALLQFAPDPKQP